MAISSSTGCLKQPVGDVEDARRASSGDDAKLLHVILLFLGSTAARQGDPQEADIYYTEALRQDPYYARARLGQALMVFDQARDGCSAGSVDAKGLDNAIAGYKEARDFPSSPTEGIPTKTAFYLGQAYLCQALAGNVERWDMAQEQLLRVVERYQTNNDYRVKYLAAEAWFHLGILYTKKDESLEGNRDELAHGEEAFQQAIELSGLADRQATLAIGWRVHGKMAECDRAEQDMVQADAAYLLFESTNPVVDTQDIKAFRQQVLDELTNLCPTALR